MKARILPLIICSLIALDCANFRNIGSDLGEGVMNQVKASADSIGYNLVTGVRRSLTSDESRRALAHLVDSVVTAAGSAANLQARGLRDSLLTDAVEKWASHLIETAVGSLNKNLLDAKTVARLKREINGLVSGIGTHLLNDSLMIRVAAVRDTLIGSRTSDMIRSAVDTALGTFAARFDRDINPRLKEDLTFLQKNATWIIILVVVATLVIIWFVWRQKERYLALTKLLTVRIAGIPDPAMKEQLKESISQNARDVGVEDMLRSLLDRQGMLHKD